MRRKKRVQSFSDHEIQGAIAAVDAFLLHGIALGQEDIERLRAAVKRTDALGQEARRAVKKYDERHPDKILPQKDASKSPDKQSDQG